MTDLKYNVEYLRAQGMTVRWGKTSQGAPIIFGLTVGGVWVAIDECMWKRAQVVGIKEAFEEGTVLIEFFSIAA